MGKKEATDSYDRIIKYTGLFGGVQGIVVLINIVRTKLVSMLLGPTGFGITESFNRTLNLVKSTTDLGVPFSAVKTVSECKSSGADARLEESVLITRTWAFLTALAGMVLCAQLSPLFSYWAFEGDWGYTLSFLMLSPMAAFSAITGGETAIMKGTGMLRELAKSQLITVVATLLISIPLLWKFGLQGIAPSLVLVAFASMVITCRYTFRTYPYRVKPFSGRTLRKGFGMIRLGIFFTITSFFGAGAFSIIANYLMKHGNAEITGIYSAGYLLISYLGMFVFSAMESDYFPRLSAVNQDRQKVNELVNSQAEVAILLMAPMIVGFIVFLGIIVNLLLTTRFLEAIPMARLAVMGLAFKAMTTPLSYVSLAKGDSKTFMLQEVLYDVVFVAAVLISFNIGGVTMTGAALTIAAIADMAIVYVITHIRYGITFSKRALSVFLAQLPIIAATWAALNYLDGLWQWSAGLVLLAVSALHSYYYLKKHTSFIRSLSDKVKNKLGL
ncbi:MAG: oligosaccharide flippase family protein [Bacteroidaceae bacterium]|nr:oligosaccharide flippase family protein [Bacteroidaceae bacterium]